MTTRDHDEREARELVRRICEAYAPPPLTAIHRARFDAELDARIARRSWRVLPWAVALAASGGAAALLLARVSAMAPATGTAAEDAAGSDERFVFALAGEQSDAIDEALPGEYRAIASLLELP